MSRLFNKVTGTVDNLSPEEAQQAYRDGSHEIPKSEPLYLRTPDGETIKIAAEEIETKQADIQEGLATGQVSFADDVQAAKTDDAERLTGQAYERMATFAQAAALGAGNLLTAGGLALAGKLDKGDKLGRITQEAAKREEADPYVSMAGELAGQVAATAPLGAVTGATRLMEAGSMGAAGAVEGAAYGLQEGVKEVSEEDLENPGQIAQVLASSIGLNALLGGVAGKVIQKTPEILSKTGASAKKGLQSLWQRRVGSEMSDGLAEVIEKRAGSLSSSGQKARQNIFVNSKKVGEYGQQLRVSLDKIDNAKQTLSEAMQGTAKKETFAKLLPKDIDDTAMAHAVEYVGQYKALASSYLEKAEIVGVGKATLRKMAKEADELETLLKPGKAIDGFVALDTLKRRAGLWRKKLEMKAPALADDLEDFYTGVRSHLEDVNVYGKAAEAQKEINGVWSDLITNDNNFRRMFLTKSGEKLGWGERLTGDPGKIQSFLDNIGMFKKELHEEVFERQIALVDQFQGKVQKYVDFDSKTASQLQEATQALKETSKFYSQAKEVMRDYNQFVGWSKQRQSLLGDSSLIGGVVAGSIAGGPLGGLVGGAVGLGAKVAIDPVRRIHALHTLDNLVPHFREVVQKSLKLPAPKISMKAPKAALRVTYHKVVEQVRHALSNPEPLIGQLAKQTGDTEHAAPQTALLAQTTVSQAVQYLAAQIPQQDTMANAFGKPTQRPVSDTQMRKYLQIYRALDNPATLIEDLRRGNLSRDAVVAVKTVYPEVYSIFATEALNEFADKDLTYQKQLQLGILLDMPVNATMDPKYIASVQTITTGVDEPQPPGGGGGGGPLVSDLFASDAGGSLAKYKRN